MSIVAEFGAFSYNRCVTEKDEMYAEAELNGGVKCALSAMQGWRPSMEDDHTIDLNIAEGEGNGELPQNTSLLCVYDGHGGSDVAIYAAAHFKEELRRQPELHEGCSVEEMQEAFRKAYLAIDVKIREEVNGYDSEQMGCTALTALVTPTHHFMAWAGDSRGVLCRAGKAVALSKDHKPNNAEERDRIHNAGGSVFRGRINGMLAVARAMGDHFYKSNEDLQPEQQLVSVVPEFISHERHADDEFIVLACDGIWDVMSNQDVCTAVSGMLAAGMTDLQDITNRILDNCLLANSKDNMTIMICLLNTAEKHPNITRHPEGYDSKQQESPYPVTQPENEFLGVEDRLLLPTHGLAREMFRVKQEDVESWDEQGVVDNLLNKCGFGKYVEIFLENGIDGECLIEVTSQEFKNDLEMDEKDVRFLASCIRLWTGRDMM